ncbi:flagellinolysin [Paenibacillus wynnii]|uniref:flagellinolysin n=1 Tax=Paenibacillus wynnii TaxID=268407 RepID=UPI002793C6A7|nr:flagellinolysin [Paenibacillus wynnii]MDQ0192181.1 flagellin [Paenibacillus wynnii]
MRIQHNITSLNTYQSLSNNTTQVSKSIEKLSSGLRINRAGDDAAGLSISEKMRGQIRGLTQASRNIQDGISLIQTAEGGLNEVHSLLQRGRELSVQANNDTNTVNDLGSIQDEIKQINQEIDRIANNTEFNTTKLLNQSSVSPAAKQAILENLQKGWLAASEDLVSSVFGIGGNNMNLTIVLDDTLDGAGNTLAAVSYSFVGGVPGTATSLALHIDMQDFLNTTYPDGGGWISNDRIIAHEMVHAATAASINIATGMQNWFMEGVAEAAHGADERLSISLSSLSEQQLADRMGTGTSAWGGTSDDYSMAFAAIRYMDHIMEANGGTGVKDLLQEMSADTTLTLNDAINANASLGVAGINSITDFAARFQSSAVGGGVDYIINTLVPKLSNADTGSLAGLDRATDLGIAGSSLDNDSVVDEGSYGTITADPMSTYVEVWPVISSLSTKVQIHLGANTGQTMEFSLCDVKSSSLGIQSVDVTSNANTAISKFDSALQMVSSYRSSFGAVQNRLEHALTITNTSGENLAAAESRIRDVDMAKEMMGQTKNSILAQAAQAMLAQANQQPQGVLQLLR